jgi:hypothetical protein
MAAEYRMSLSEATRKCLQHLTYSQLGLLLGVTADQVYKYSTGYTKSASDKVIDSFYDKFNILLDVYSSESSYLEYRELKRGISVTSDNV